MGEVGGEIGQRGGRMKGEVGENWSGKEWGDRMLGNVGKGVEEKIREKM